MLVIRRKVAEFLKRERKDFRKWKTLTHDQLQEHANQLPFKLPPLWAKLKDHQKVCFLIGARNRTFAYWCDTGCVAGDTLIETDRGPVRIDKLTREGKPIVVWSLTPQGLQLVSASCPFKRGPTALYEVSFRSGRTITVTGQHRFFSDRGWIYCADLVNGAQLPIFAHDRPLSTSGPCLLESDASVTHYSRTTPGYQDRLSTLSYDAPLLSVADTDPVSSPSQGGAQERSHHPWWRMGDPGTSRRYNDQNAFDHPAKIHCERLGNRDPSRMEYPCGGYVSEQSAGWCHSAELTLSISNPAQLICEDPALVLEGVSDRTNQPCSNSCDTVTSVRYVRTDVYYDLHVPIHENYIAHGLCHHNTGKTALSIALSNYFKRAGVSQSNLVLVPRRVNCGEWEREILKHSPDTPYVILEEGSQRKWELLEGNPKAELVITTYAGLARMCCEKVEVRARHGKTKRKLAPQPELVGKLCDRFQGLYLDESTAIGSPRKTLAFRICRKMMATTPIRFCMSGTPFGRDPTTLWGQMFIVDGGDTLGPNLTLFRAVFFKSKRNFWGGMEYKFDRKMEDRLHRVLAHRSIRYEAEAADLPEVIRERKVITLPKDAGAYFDKMRKELKAARGNTVEIRNIFLRMRQLSSGFIGYRDDDSGERAEFEFPYNPKLEMLLHLIESIAEDRKIIVYHDFIHSGRVIGRELSALKIPYLHVWGGTKHPSREIATFNNSRKHSVLLLNNSMVMGLNVQVAQYGLYYESPVPAIIRKQSERRIERQHSEHSHVFLYDLIVAGTMDERILRFHKQGKDLLKAIIDGDEELG